jgi:hypothetical protein
MLMNIDHGIGSELTLGALESNVNIKCIQNMRKTWN